MTVSTVVDHNDYTGNGVTTSFPYTFRIFKKSDLAVSVVDLSENITVLVLDTDYTVTNAGGYNGGNVVLTTPLTSGWQISIARELEPTQETDLRNQGKFFAEVHEDAFDKLTMLIQQAYSVFRLALRKPSSIANWYDALGNYIRNLKDPVQDQDAATKKYVDGIGAGNVSYIDSLFRRTLRVPESYINPLPGIEDRKNKILAFDNAGNVIAILSPSGSASDVLIELANQGDKKVGSTYGGTVYSDYQPSIYQKSGLFSAGYLITEAHQTLYYATTGHWYRYLGTIPVGGLLVNPGSTPDSNWEDVDFNQVVRLRKLNMLSTASIAGYVGVNIDMPVSIIDSDNQGVSVESGVTIWNDIPTQNRVKTSKIQSAFRVEGDNTKIIGINGLGSAESDNSATSEFITTRMAWATGKTIKNILVESVEAQHYTTGIHFIGTIGAVSRNCKFSNMQYSPVTLGSAGGYGVLTEACTDTTIEGLNFIATAYGRHAVYVSNTQPFVSIDSSGSRNVSIRGFNLDYSGVDMSISDSGMAPIHVRPSRNVTVENGRSIGSASLVTVSNDQGGVERLRILNNIATDMKSAQNRVCASFTIGRSDKPNLINDVDVIGNYTEIKKGDGQADGNDLTGLFRRVDNLRLISNHCIQDTGACYSLDTCNNVLIDDITDILTVPANATRKPVIVLASCTNVTIGNIKTTRGTSDSNFTEFDNGTSSIVQGLNSCADVTCRFPRRVSITLNNGTVSGTSDVYGIISAGGITFGSGFITVALRVHVTQQAANTASVTTMTANGVNPYITSTTGKTLTINFLKPDGTAQPMSTYVGTIRLIFES